VLISKLDELPDVRPDERYWILRTLVIRRDFIVKYNISLKNHLHDLLTGHFPNYRKFFYHIDRPSALAFFARYPSPARLRDTTVEELAAMLHKVSMYQLGTDKAQMILDNAKDAKDIPLQEVRDEAVRSTIRQIEFHLAELEQIKKSLAQVLDIFGTTLTTMPGIDTVCAAQMLSCIGDIRKFSTPAKLARYSGVAPVTYASGKADKKFANKRGDRELNSLLYCLAVRSVAVMGSSKKLMNSALYEYYHRKLSEGKTKKQALKCVQRRLVNIIWKMLTHNVPYENPPLIEKN
jgi:transposase